MVKSMLLCNLEIKKILSLVNIVLPLHSELTDFLTKLQQKHQEVCSFECFLAKISMKVLSVICIGL